LPLAARQLATTPIALIELALQGQLSLYVLQTGWRWDGAYLGSEAPTLVWADDPILDLKEAPLLRPGPVPLLPEHLDALRNGKVFVREVEDPDTGLRVRLLNPVWITFDAVLIDPEESDALRVAQRGATGAQPAPKPLRGLEEPETFSDADPRHLKASEVARLLGLSKAGLREVLKRAPADLPGAPRRVGNGKKRQHLRWEVSNVEEWFASYRRWEGQQRQAGRRAGGSNRRKRTGRKAAAQDGPVDWTAVARDANRR
jgi:hypothetical protein